MEEQEQQAYSEDLVAYVVTQLEDKQSHQQITDNLVAMGFDHDEISVFVTQIDNERRARRRKGGITAIGFGGLLVAIGVGISVGISYLSGPSGTYVISVGLFLVAAYLIVMGLLEWSSNVKLKE